MSREGVGCKRTRLGFQLGGCATPRPHPMNFLFADNPFRLHYDHPIFVLLRKVSIFLEVYPINQDPNFS